MLWATFGAALPPFVLISYGGLLAASNRALAAELAERSGRALRRCSACPAGTRSRCCSSVGRQPRLGARAEHLLRRASRCRRSACGSARRWSTVAIAGGHRVVGSAARGDRARSVSGDPRACRRRSPCRWPRGRASSRREMMLRTRRLPPAVAADARRRVPGLALGQSGACSSSATVVGLGLIRSELPWLQWEGYLFRAVGVDPRAGSARATSASSSRSPSGCSARCSSAGVPAVRRQECHS